MEPKFRKGDRVRYVKVDDIGALSEYDKEFTIIGVNSDFHDEHTHYRVEERASFSPSEHRLVLVSSDGCKHGCAPCKGKTCGFYERRV
jgi:hypothetical protein